MISRYETDWKNHPLFDEATWCVAIKRATKSRIYGVLGMPKSMVKLALHHNPT